MASNDDPLVFQQTTTVSIPETPPVDTIVVNVTATDDDFGVNSDIRYSITSGNTENAFVIDSITGSIHVIGKLNYTRTSLYTLTIKL